MIEVFEHAIVIYIDYAIALDIVRQTSLITTSTNKLNFRLIRISNYLQRFNLDIRHKLDKQHIMSNALSRLAFDNNESFLRKSFANDYDELDALLIILTKNALLKHSALNKCESWNSFVDTSMLLIAFLIEINAIFRQRIVNDYKTNLNWQRIIAILEVNDSDENVVKLSFDREENDLIYRSNDFITSYDYEFKRLCISYLVIQNVMKMTHDESHLEYARCYDKIASSYYIRDLIRYLRDYLKHYS